MAGRQSRAQKRDEVLRARRAAKRRRPAERPGCGVILLCALFAAGFLIIGLHGLRILSRDMLEARRSRLAWEPAQGVMERVVRLPGKWDSFSLAVTYAFEVEGRIHRGDRIAFGITNRNFDRAAAKRYAAGEVVWVWYDPANPEHSVLERRMGGYPVGMTLFCLLFAAAGVVFSGVTVFMVRETARSWSVRPPAA